MLRFLFINRAALAERVGRIPGIRTGKYVRFKLSDVERALTEGGTTRSIRIAF